MTDTARESTAASAVELMTHYSFDHGEAPIQQLVDQWLKVYPAQWVRLALIEALYQGRYKAISVEQILALWQRRGQPIYRFNHEFERLVCNRFPRKLSARSPQGSDSAPTKRERIRPHFRPQPFFPPVHPDTTPPSLPRQEPPASDLRSVESSLGKQPFLRSVSARQEPTPGSKVAKPSRETAVANDSAAGIGIPPAGTGIGKDSIHQFVPIAESSDFCTKLTAIALSERARKVPTDNLKT